MRPCDTFDFRVFSTGVPLNQKNERLLAHLRSNSDFEANLTEYHRRAKSTKPKGDPRSFSSSRALAGQSGDRKRKSEGEENGDRVRKGGDRSQQQAAGREGGRAGDAEDKRKAGRAGDVEDKRKAGGVRAGEPGIPKTSVRRGGPAISPKELLRADGADATTTMQLSPRRPAYRAMHLSVTASKERKV